MELQSELRGLIVADRHRHAIQRSIDGETGRQASQRRAQRMVATDPYWRRQAGKGAGPAMLQFRAFAMARRRRPSHAAACNLDNRLMPKTDADHRNAAL